MEDAARLVLVFGVLPLWIVAGLADWACHRRSRIEASAGLPENVFHWVLFGQMGIAVAAVLLLEVNGALMLLVLAAFLLHEATVYAELRYVVSRREVRPVEQMVHSFMEVLPLAVVAVLAVAHRDALGDVSLRWKARPWPAGELLGLLAGVVLLNVLPLAEEGWRCLRARR